MRGYGDSVGIVVWNERMDEFTEKVESREG
jgi:hypothetical protein